MRAMASFVASISDSCTILDQRPLDCGTKKAYMLIVVPLVSKPIRFPILLMKALVDPTAIDAGGAFVANIRRRVGCVMLFREVVRVLRILLRDFLNENGWSLTQMQNRNEKDTTYHAPFPVLHLVHLFPLNLIL
jgi:hypothetical protein